MKSPFTLITSLSILGALACTKLGDPYEGVTADNLFSLTIKNSSGTNEPILPADGSSALECTIELNNDLALYSRTTVTAASDVLLISLTGSSIGATNSLVIPFGSRRSTFFIVAPRDYQELAYLSITSGGVRTVTTVKLKEAAPNRLDVAPTVLRATLGTPFSIITTLTDTSQIPRAVSGKLPVQYDILSATSTTPRLPVGRSVAQTDGTSIVTTTFTMGDTGVFRYRARTLGIHSQPFIIRCR